MELRHLRYFLAIAENCSFRRAAEDLLVSQPTLSQQMKSLEKELGTPLFERIGRGVRLTQAGELFAKYAHRSINILKEGQTAILEFDSMLRGNLRVGVLQTVGTYLAPEAVARFASDYPAVDLQIKEMSAPDIEGGIINGAIDLGISFEPIGKPDIQTQPLFSEQLVLVVSESHPLKRRKKIRCADLSNHRLCLLGREYATRQLIDSCFAGAGIALDVAVELNSVAACAAVAAAGGPATILPELAASNNTSMHTVGIERPIIKRNICLMNAKTQSPIRAQSKFAEVVMDVVASRS